MFRNKANTNSVYDFCLFIIGKNAISFGFAKNQFISSRDDKIMLYLAYIVSINI